MFRPVLRPNPCSVRLNKCSLFSTKHDGVAAKKIGTGKFVHVHTMQAWGERRVRGTAPLILNLDYVKVSGQLHVMSALPQARNPDTHNRWLGGPQSRSDRIGGQNRAHKRARNHILRPQEHEMSEHYMKTWRLKPLYGRLQDVLTHTLRLLNQQGRRVISTDKHLYVWSTRSPTELRLFCALFVGRHLSLRDTSDL
jgi:hypothetical protein